MIMSACLCDLMSEPGTVKNQCFSSELKQSTTLVIPVFFIPNNT
jgi:hypothetical protein